MADTPRVAVLIDCDNVSARAARKILAETSRHGTLSIKRAYGDFTSSRLAGWRSVLPSLAIQPVLQFPYSAAKNATDMALIIDAMDLLTGTDTDVFCIISSDSDFTPLATRLRQSGKRVYGIGAKSTPQGFRNACDRFTFLELLTDAEDLEESSAPEPATAAVSQPQRAATPTADADADAAADSEDDSLPDLPTLLPEAIRATAKDDGWAPLSSVGWYIVNNHPTFDSRNYGFPKLGDLMRDQKGIKIETRKDAGGTGQLWVSLVTGSGGKDRRS